MAQPETGRPANAGGPWAVKAMRNLVEMTKQAVARYGCVEVAQRLTEDQDAVHRELVDQVLVHLHVRPPWVVSADGTDCSLCRASTASATDEDR